MADGSTSIAPTQTQALSLWNVDTAEWFRPHVGVMH
jgi:hypothetical protein